MLRVPIADKKCRIVNRTIALVDESSTETVRFEIENVQGDLVLSSLNFALHTVNAQKHEEVYTALAKTVRGSTLCIDFPITRAVTGCAGEYRFELAFASDASMSNVLYRVAEDYFMIAAAMDSVDLGSPAIIAQIANNAALAKTSADNAALSETAAGRAAAVVSSAQADVNAKYGTILTAASQVATDAAQVAEDKDDADGYATAADASADIALAAALRAETAQQAAELAIVKPPLIGDNGNWQLYDTSTQEYADSGKPSQGTDGTSTYVHIKYSAYANPADEQMQPTPAKYIGIATTTSVTPPSTASSYTWSKFKGDDGTSVGDMTKAVYDTDDDGKVDAAQQADTFATARKINGVDFDGSVDITVTADPNTHTHTVSEVTDFPSSMPASDVSAWAKEATKPTYTNTEVGAAATEHAHGIIKSDGSVDLTYTPTVDGGILLTYPNSAGLGSLLRILPYATVRNWIGAAPTSHTHGGISADGKIGSTADLPVFTGSGGAVGTKSVSDARTALGVDSAVAFVDDADSTTKTLAVLADRTVYRLGTLTALTVTAYPAGHYNTLVCFTAGTGITVSLPTTVWNGNIVPTFTAGKYYEVSIRDGNACFGEF